MAQIWRENIPEKAQAFSFPKVIELWLYDKHFLKKAKIGSLGHLNNAHRGSVVVDVYHSDDQTKELGQASVLVLFDTDVNRKE